MLSNIPYSLSHVVSSSIPFSSLELRRKHTATGIRINPILAWNRVTANGTGRTGHRLYKGLNPANVYTEDTRRRSDFPGSDTAASSPPFSVPCA